MINFLLQTILLISFSSFHAQENHIMEKRISKPNNTYIALYHLKPNKKKEFFAYRLIWAAESINSSGEKSYNAQADSRWKSIEEKSFAHYTPQQVYDLLRREYTDFDNEQNTQLLNKYVLNF